jgi:hypothetical protein
MDLVYHRREPKIDGISSSPPKDATWEVLEDALHQLQYRFQAMEMADRYLKFVGIQGPNDQRCHEFDEKRFEHAHWMDDEWKKGWSWCPGLVLSDRLLCETVPLYFCWS